MGGKNNKHIKITPELQQLIDGLVISDANIRLWKNHKTGRIGIKQTIRYKSWIQDIQKQFVKNNIDCSIKERISNVHLPQDPPEIKTQFKSIELSTLMYTELAQQYNRWYKNKIKTIPKDIQLTPITLANWYMGDGNTDIQKIGKLGQKYYRITLCTECFTLKEHQQLKQQLEKKYNWQPYIQKFRNTQRIRISKKQDIINFLKITYPYIS